MLVNAKDEARSKVQLIVSFLFPLQKKLCCQVSNCYHFLLNTFKWFVSSQRHQSLEIKELWSNSLLYRTKSETPDRFKKGLPLQIGHTSHATICNYEISSQAECLSWCKAKSSLIQMIFRIKDGSIRLENTSCAWVGRNFWKPIIGIINFLHHKWLHAKLFILRFSNQINSLTIFVVLPKCSKYKNMTNDVQPFQLLNSKICSLLDVQRRNVLSSNQIFVAKGNF